MSDSTLETRLEHLRKKGWNKPGKGDAKKVKTEVFSALELVVAERKQGERQATVGDHRSVWTGLESTLLESGLKNPEAVAKKLKEELFPAITVAA